MTPILRNGPTSGVVLCASIGKATLEPLLFALQPLRRALPQARAVLLDDGTLTGADRVRLARHCGDPEIRPVLATRGFPGGAEWALLLAMLDGRRSAYWVMLDSPPSEALSELVRAIAANRSFAVLEDGGSPAGLDAMAAEGWPYLSASPALMGFAAGGPGRVLAATILARLEHALGTDSVHRPETARFVANFVLARENAPVILPVDRATAGSFTPQGNDGIGAG